MAVTFLVAPAVESAGVEGGSVRQLAVILGIAAIVAGYLGNRGQLRAVVATSALGVALTLWQLNAIVLPVLDPSISSRTAARDAATQANGGPVRAYALHRAWHYGLEYYLGQPIHEWTREDPAGAVVLTTNRGMRAMQVYGANLVVLRHISDDAVLVRTGQPDGRSMRFP
jgi:hypothetical protein